MMIRSARLLIVIGAAGALVMSAGCVPTKEPVKPPPPSEPAEPPGPPFVFTASLDGVQVAPPTTSSATGSATVTLDATETTITVELSFSGLTGTTFNATIQGPAGPGVNGPIVKVLPGFPTGVTSGTYQSAPLSITATQVSDLRAELFYIIIKTITAPAGEIRGQLTV